MFHEWDLLKWKGRIDKNRSFVPEEPRTFDRIMKVTVWVLIFAMGVGMLYRHMT